MSLSATPSCFASGCGSPRPSPERITDPLSVTPACRQDPTSSATLEELCVEYVAKSRARDRMVYLPDLEVSSKDEVFRLLDKPKVRAMDASASSQPYASSSQDTTLTEALDDTEDTTEKDAALATLELQALPETEQDLDDRVRSMLRAVMKRPRSSSQPHGPTAAAVRMQVDTRAKEITGARNVLRDAIRSGGK